MKKLSVMFLLFVLLVSFSLVSAPIEEPGAAGDGQYEGATGAIENFTPVDDEGRLNFSKWRPFVTAAEERIDNINLWLNENAGWLTFIFGMVPAISWLFTFNLWAWITFLITLAFGSKDATLETLEKSRIPMSEGVAKGIAYTLGPILFLLILAFRGTYVIALLLNGLFSVWWGRLILLGIAIFGSVLLRRFMEWWGKDVSLEMAEGEIKDVKDKVARREAEDEDRKEREREVKEEMRDSLADVNEDVDDTMADMDESSDEDED